MFFTLIFVKNILFFFFILLLNLFFFFLNLNMNIMFKLNEFFLYSNMNIIFFFDHFTFMFLLTILMVIINVFEFMNFYMMKSKNMIMFMFFLMIFVFSMLLLVCSMNLITMIFGWEGLGFSSFYLIFYYNNYESWKSSIKTLINNKIGDSFIMMSLIYMIMFNSTIYMNFFFFFCIMTKSAQYPFMSWLPMAMAAPTPISSMVHSSTLVTAGLYIIYRYMGFFTSFLNLNIYMNICLISMFISGLKALLEKDMKKVIALSTLSQVSMILFMIIINLKTLAFIYMCNHAFFKSMMFINLGFSMLNNFMSQNFFNSNVYMLNSFFNISFKISVLNLMNMSFFSSFFLKEIFVNMITINSYNILNMFFFYLSTFFTMVYSLKMLLFSFSINFNMMMSMNFYMKYKMILLFFTNIFSIIFVKLILYMGFFISIDNVILMLIYIFMLIMMSFMKYLNFKISFFLMFLNFLLYSFPMMKIIKSFNYLSLWMETMNFFFIFKSNMKKKNNMNFKTIILAFLLLLMFY